MWAPFPSILQKKAVDHGPARPRILAVFFETMSKRRKGFPSETKVKRGGVMLRMEQRCNMKVLILSLGCPWIEHGRISQRSSARTHDGAGGPLALVLFVNQR
jgi:hypothetical protein